MITAQQEVPTYSNIDKVSKIGKKESRFGCLENNLSKKIEDMYMYTERISQGIGRITVLEFMPYPENDTCEDAPMPQEMGMLDKVAYAIEKDLSSIINKLRIISNHLDELV